MQKSKMHDQFGNMIFLSGNSHMLENLESFARGQICSPYEKKITVNGSNVFSIVLPMDSTHKQLCMFI